MIKFKHKEIELFVFAAMASGLALADCPSSMPTQLLQDCITYEGAGSAFPSSDYAHMDMYNKWLIEQQRAAGSNRQAGIPSLEKK